MPTTQAAFEELADELGDACVRIDLPERYAEAWDVASHDHGGRDGAQSWRDCRPRRRAVSKVLRDLVAEGRKVGATQYQRRSTRRALGGMLGDIFSECNAIITPAANGVAPKGLEATGDPVFCTLWTLTGLAVADAAAARRRRRHADRRATGRCARTTMRDCCALRSGLCEHLAEAE